jgi:hypothetical protein
VGEGVEAQVVKRTCHGRACTGPTHDPRRGTRVGGRGSTNYKEAPLPHYCFHQWTRLSLTTLTRKDRFVIREVAELEYPFTSWPACCAAENTRARLDWLR